MSERVAAEVVRTGLWNNNAGLVQLLGLCPLLAVSTSFVNGLGLGMATTLVLLASNVTVSMIREFVRPEIRIPVFVLVIASFVTAVELAMNAWFHDLFRVLGIFIPADRHQLRDHWPGRGLRLARAPRARGAGWPGDGPRVHRRARHARGRSRTDRPGLAVLRRAHDVRGRRPGPSSSSCIDGGFLLALLPPGAFIGLGLLVAAEEPARRARAAPARGAHGDRAAAGRRRGRARLRHRREMNQRQAPRASTSDCATANPAPRTELHYGTPVRAAGGGGALRAGDRQGREPRHGQTVPRRQYAAKRSSCSAKRD
jgi:Na+-translocating ferredoxin:NAD+ oxidoreductase subunit E